MCDDDIKANQAADAQSTLTDMLAALGITPEWEIENIKENSMNRFNVKKSRRSKIKQILDDAFQQLLERAANVKLRGAPK